MGGVLLRAYPFNEEVHDGTHHPAGVVLRGVLYVNHFGASGTYVSGKDGATLWRGAGTHDSWGRV